jgi:hypothetical protein
MRRSILILALMAVSLGMSHATAAVVYVSRSFNAFGTVDLATGAYTNIGTTSVGLNGLSFGPNGTLYGMGSNNTLYTVNPATAGLTLVGPTNSFFGQSNLAARGDGALFATDPFTNGPGGFVYRVNPTTGAATSIGQSGLTGGFAAPGGLAFGPTGSLFLLYGLFTDNLYTLNQTNGVASLVGASGVELNGLVFSEGTAYAFDFFGRIYTINPTTGAATFTGVTVTGGFGPVNAAAGGPGASAVIPEPASLLLVGLGGVAAAGCVWRRRAKDVKGEENVPA